MVWCGMKRCARGDVWVVASRWSGLSSEQRRGDQRGFSAFWRAKKRTTASRRGGRKSGRRCVAARSCSCCRKKRLERGLRVLADRCFLLRSVGSSSRSINLSKLVPSTYSLVLVRIRSLLIPCAAAGIRAHTHPHTYTPTCLTSTTSPPVFSRVGSFPRHRRRCLLCSLASTNTNIYMTASGVRGVRLRAPSFGSPSATHGGARGQPRRHAPGRGKRDKPSTQASFVEVVLMRVRVSASRSTRACNRLLLLWCDKANLRGERFLRAPLSQRPAGFCPPAKVSRQV